MARPPGGGLLGRLLSGVRGRPDKDRGDQDRREAAQRLEAARERLKQEIPPPEETDPRP